MLLLSANEAVQETERKNRPGSPFDNLVPLQRVPPIGGAGRERRRGELSSLFPGQGGLCLEAFDHLRVSQLAQ